mgnify:CR=1 FL=1
MICVGDFPSTMTERSNLPSLADLSSFVTMRPTLRNETREVENLLSKKTGKHSGNSKDESQAVFYEMKGVGV